MSFNEGILLIFKTIFCYMFLFGVLKIMGKRELGEISTFDMVVFLVISELFSLSLNNVETSLLYSILPITVIVVLQVLTAIVSLKNKKIRNFMEGKTSYLIIDGVINQEELKRNRYSLSDLMLQIRQKDINTISDVAFAILEGNGSLSVINKSEQKLKFPEPLIEDGVINKTCMNYLKFSIEDVYKEIVKKGFKSIEEVYYMEAKLDGTFLIVSKKVFENKNTIEQ